MLLSFFVTFNLFSHEENHENYKMNFNVDDTINKYDILITQENDITDVFFKIHKCKGCTQRDLNENIICSKNRNVFVIPVYCTAPKAKLRNGVKGGSNSMAILTCKKLTSRIICEVKAKTYSDYNAVPDKNLLTKLGNLTLEYMLIDKDKNEHKDEDNNINENLSKDIKEDKPIIVKDEINQKDNIESKPVLSKLEKIKSKCIKLGLEEKTEKFADCVLKFY
jgi:hypothetical protein